MGATSQMNELNSHGIVPEVVPPMLYQSKPRLQQTTQQKKTVDEICCIEMNEVFYGFSAFFVGPIGR